MSTPSTDLEQTTSATLAEQPLINQTDAQRLALIKATVAKDANDAEVGMFLELAAKYDLDPFAKEIWCAKGGSQDGGGGRLLIMVGRDGLRKIAQRNGLDPKGDVVRAEDVYEVEWVDSEQDARQGEWDANGCAPFHRVTHKAKGMGSARGAIVGAWSRVVEKATGREAGWFEATTEEYKPTNAKKLQFSPWGTQEGVMTLAAAERQALRQATPLSGILVEGEGEINEERALGTGRTVPDHGALQDAILQHIPDEHRDRAMELMLEMNDLAPGSWSAGKVNMVFAGKTPYAVSAELGQIERQIEELRARPTPTEDEAIADAEVVDEPAAQDDAREADQGDAREETPAPVAEPREPTEDERKKLDRVMVIQELLDEDDTLSEDEKSDLEAERDSLEGELPPDIGPGQESLPL